jgi:hypothetical protein
MTIQEKREAMLADLLAERAVAMVEGPMWWWHRLDEKIDDLKLVMSLDK